MSNHRYTYPRVTELTELRLGTTTTPEARQNAPRTSQRRLVESSLLRVRPRADGARRPK